MIYKYNSTTLKAEPIGFKYFIYGGLGLFLLFTTLGASVSYKIYTEKIPVIYRMVDVQFTPDNLKQQIHKLNLPHKDIIWAQCKLETGNFSSSVFKNNNNLTGMRPAFSRINTQSGQDLGFARYNTWTESLTDYAIYCSLYCKDMSDEQFLDFLDRVYAPNQNYKDNILKMLKHNI